jgi:hypothetical protein
MIESSIQASKDILTELDKGFLSLEFSKLYFDKFLQTGQLSKQDLLDFYSEDDVRLKFKLLKDELDSL